MQFGFLVGARQRQKRMRMRSTLQERISSISSQRSVRQRGDGEEQGEEGVEGMVKVKVSGEEVKMEVEVKVEEEVLQKPRLASQQSRVGTHGGTKRGRKTGAMKARNGHRMDGGPPATTGTAMHGKMASSRCTTLLTKTRKSKPQRLRRANLGAASQQQKEQRLQKNLKRARQRRTDRQRRTHQRGARQRQRKQTGRKLRLNVQCHRLHPRNVRRQKVRQRRQKQRNPRCPQERRKTRKAYRSDTRQALSLPKRSRSTTSFSKTGNALQQQRKLKTRWNPTYSVARTSPSAGWTSTGMCRHVVLLQNQKRRT